MSAPPHTAQVWRFGIFEANAEREELRRSGMPIKLREQSFRILRLLLEHPGELVTREDLRKALWPADTYVDFDHSLNVAVMKLREALGDTADKPLYIETVPKHGYRFIAPIMPLAGAPPDLSMPQIEFVRVQANDLLLPETHTFPVVRVRTRFRTKLWVTISSILLIVTVAAIWNLYQPLPPLRVTDYVQLTNDGRPKEVIGTNGSSLFLYLRDSNRIAQVPVSGGQIVPIPIDLPSGSLSPGEAPDLLAISPDGSSLLVAGHLYPDFERDLWVVGVTGRPVRLLIRAGNATWSPDGKQVLFASSHGDLYVMQAEGGTPHLLARSSAPSGSLQHVGDWKWSPDGTRIRFVRDRTIWEVAQDGSNPHPLILDSSNSNLSCCGRWTPDGDFFLFLAGSTLLKGSSYHPPGAQIWAIDERRGPPKPHRSTTFQLTSGPTLWGAPVPSYDGRRIFARGTNLRGELVRFDNKTKQFRPYLGGISAEFLSFSHDGRYIAYVSFPEGILWRADRDGTGLAQLTAPPVHPKRIRWSPNDESILFVDYSPEFQDEMYIVPSRGGTPQRLIPGDMQPETHSTWSPDGKEVMFSTDGSYSAGPEIIPPEVHIFNLATHKTTVLGNFTAPSWSPDGRFVAGLKASTTGDNELILFDFQTRRWTTLFRGLSLSSVSWSHDGRFVYFMCTLPEGGRILRIGAAVGDIEEVADLREFRFTGWYGSWVGLDPNDNPLLLRDLGTDEIYALTLER